MTYTITYIKKLIKCQLGKLRGYGFSGYKICFSPKYLEFVL